MGVAAGCAALLEAAGCSSLELSFLLQPTNIHRPRRQSKLNIAMIFLFIMSPFLESGTFSDCRTAGLVPGFAEKQIPRCARNDKV
jgi:hypothetical protein